MLHALSTEALAKVGCIFHVRTIPGTQPCKIVSADALAYFTLQTYFTGPVAFISVVSDGMISSNHRSNTELIAQGIANIASGLFGGIPATGAIARTATIVRNGGRTPITGMVHAVTLLLIMLFFGKYAAMIPLSCLAGILIVVAYNMSEWRSLISILRGSKYDVLVGGDALFQDNPLKRHSSEVVVLPFINQENSKCFELILSDIKNTNDVFESDTDIIKRFQTDTNDYK